jgi:hypothetical protein
MSRASLIRLSYFSSSNLAGSAEQRSKQEQQIVRSAQKKNEFTLVSSVLVSVDGWFLQVLEGDRGDIQAAFDRISRDNRHRDILIMEWREIQKREMVFPLEFIERNEANRHLFATFDVPKVLAMGRPKPPAMLAFASTLQSGHLAQRGINLSLV